MKYIKAPIFFAIMILCTGTFGLFSAITPLYAFFLPKLTRQKIAHWWAILWATSIVRLTPGWQVKVEGKEHIPDLKRHKIILVANHESAADVLVLYFLNIQFRWLGKAIAFKYPIVGQAGTACGYIPIKRKERASHGESIRLSANVLRQNIPMFFFPEGTRSKTGKLKKFKNGAFKLARDEGALIVPICIENTKDLLYKGSVLPGRANVKLTVLAPIEVSKDSDIEDIAESTRQLIEAHKTT